MGWGSLDLMPAYLSHATMMPGLGSQQCFTAPSWRAGSAEDRFQQASSSYRLSLQTDAYKEVSQKPDFGSVTLSNKSSEFSWDLVEHSSAIIWSVIEVFILSGI